MRICLINNLFHPYSRGGTDRIVQLMQDGLIAQGHSVFVISTQSEKKSYAENGNYYLRSKFAELNKYNVFVRMLFVVFEFINLKNYFHIKKIIHKERVEAAITHNLRGVGFFSVVALRRIKHIHVLHDLQLIHPSGLMIFGQEKKIASCAAKAYAFLTRLFLSRAACVISPSKWLLQEHLSRGFFGKAKTVHIPNPARIQTGLPVKKEIGKKFLFVGEIEEHKGVFLLLDAFFECRKDFPDARLDIIGRGSRQDEIRSGNGVNYLGWQNKGGVEAAMAGAYCLVMPSLCYENSPTVLYEAAAISLPAIIAQIGGAEELALDLGGILFLPGQKGDLAQKMSYAIKNPDLMRKIGDSSRLKINKYEIDRYIEKISSLISD